MKDYIEGSTTSLKFHKFIWFVWMPVSFLLSFWTLIQRVTSALNTYSSASAEQLAAIILIILLVELIFVLVPVLVFIGFFKWRRYAWYLIVLESISNIITSPVLILKKYSYLDAASISGRIIGIVLDVIIVIYYFKRRYLFGVKIMGSKANDIKKCSNYQNSIHHSSGYCSLGGSKTENLISQPRFLIETPSGETRWMNITEIESNKKNSKQDEKERRALSFLKEMINE